MEQKDNIEKLILKNLDALNDNEPMEGHFERFESKLDRLHKKKATPFSIIWKVAAAVIFVIMGINQVSIYISPDKMPLFASKEVEISLASISPEYKEVEFYYTNAISVGLDQWNKFAEEGMVSTEEQTALDTEMKEFEKMYTNLQKDLQANPDDERVINAMLDYYQAKLSVINMIINKLQEIKNQKNISHENKI